MTAIHSGLVKAARDLTVADDKFRAELRRLVDTTDLDRLPTPGQTRTFEES